MVLIVEEHPINKKSVTDVATPETTTVNKKRVQFMLKPRDQEKIHCWPDLFALCQTPANVAKVNRARAG